METKFVVGGLLAGALATLLPLREAEAASQTCYVTARQRLPAGTPSILKGDAALKDKGYFDVTTSISASSLADCRTRAIENVVKFVSSNRICGIFVYNDPTGFSGYTTPNSAPCPFAGVRGFSVTGTAKFGSASYALSAVVDLGNAPRTGAIQPFFFFFRARGWATLRSLTLTPSTSFAGDFDPELEEGGEGGNAEGALPEESAESESDDDDGLLGPTGTRKVSSADAGCSMAKGTSGSGSLAGAAAAIALGLIVARRRRRR